MKLEYFNAKQLEAERPAVRKSQTLLGKVSVAFVVVGGCAWALTAASGGAKSVEIIGCYALYGSALIALALGIIGLIDSLGRCRWSWVSVLAVIGFVILLGYGISHADGF